MSTLIFTAGELKGKTIEVSSKEIKIGRDSSNDIVLNDPLVSRVHAALRSKNGSYYIFDLESHNGVYVNSLRFKFKKLFAKDIVRIGKSFFSLEQTPGSETSSKLEFSSLTLDDLKDQFNLKINELKFNEFLELKPARTELASLVTFHDFLKTKSIDEFILQLKSRFELEKALILRVTGKKVTVTRKFQEETVSEPVLEKLRANFDPSNVTIITTRVENEISNFIICPVGSRTGSYFLFLKRNEISKDDVKELGYIFLLIHTYHSRK